MAEKTSIEKAAQAAFEHDPAINLHRFPVQLEFDATKGALILEGEVENIVAKKRAFKLASAVEGVEGVMDRLRVAPSEHRGDGAVLDSLTSALLQEPALAPCTLRVQRKRETITLRESAERPASLIEVSVHDGIVELTGHVASLSHKRLAEVMAWWVPGSRDVINGLQVIPPEMDNDDEIADALRLVLEKDPLVHAGQISIRVSDRVVNLAGSVASEAEREMAEFDAWYLSGVQDVVNTVTVHGR